MLNFVKIKKSKLVRPKCSNFGIWAQNLKIKSLQKIVDFPNFEIFGRFGIFSGLFRLVLDRFGQFQLDLVGFGSFWLIPGFSKCTVAITGEIEKAYLEISIEEEDRDYLKFFQISNLFDKGEGKICKYRFTRVIFGATCSELLLNSTVNKYITSYRRCFCQND